MCPYIYIVLPSYAVFASIGAFFVLLFLYFRIERFQVEFVHFIKLFLFATVFLVLGSKILFTITQFNHLLEEFSALRLFSILITGGFVYYGGLLGMLAGVYIYVSRFTQYDKTNVFNMIAPAIPLFHAFGRFGCFMAGCCYGKELSTPILINGVIQINKVPTQLLEVVFEIIMFGILLILDRKAGRNLLKIYMLSYGVFRFLVEFLRGDVERGICMGLSTSQWISLFIIGFILLRARKRCTDLVDGNNERVDE